jgi:hypothetical protein
MARRRRSFFFDNINKRLLTDTFKNTKESKDEVDSGTTSNTQFATLKQVSQTIERSDIDDLGNVLLTSLADDQILRYDSSTSKWKNETLTLTSSLSALTDTSLTSPATSNYLVYNGSKWVNRALDLSSYATQTYVDTAVSGVVDSAPDTLNTLNELAAALGDDANFATTTATNIGTKLAKSSNLSDLTNAATARTNLGLGTAATTAATDYATSAQGTKADTAHGWGNHANAGYGTSSFSGAYADLSGKPSLFSGAYADLSGKPTIPSNTNQLTNGAGYITGITSSMVTTALGYTPGTSSFSGSYNDLSNKPTIPTNNNQLTNGAGYLVEQSLVSSQATWSNATRFKSTGNVNQGAGNHSLSCYADNGNDAFMSFHIGSDFALHFGLDGASNRLVYGGWSHSTAQYQLWSTQDFSSTNISNWNTAYGWGNHASAGYITGNQTITLTGDASGSGTTSISVTVNDDSHNHSQLNIPDTRGAARAPNYYPYRRTSYDFQNKSDTGAGGDTWNVLQTVVPWSIYSSTHRQQQLAWTGTGGLKFRYSTSDTVWAAWQTLWTSGNDGSGSGLDADLLDGLHASSFKTTSATDTSSIWIRNTAPTIYFRDTDHRGSMIHVNSNLFYVLRGSQATDSTTWATTGNGWPLTINMNNNDATFAGNVTAYSDIRLKKNIEPIGITLDQFKSIEAKRFDWKTDNKHDVGFIAQDVEAAGLVEVVKEHEDRDPGTGELLNTYKTLDYSRMVPFLWDIVQKQQVQIEELRVMINGTSK